MSTVDTATEVRPFNLEITDEQVDDLRRRIAATALAEPTTEVPPSDR